MKLIFSGWKRKKVIFSGIDWEDTRFRMTYGRSLNSLIRSIRTIGLQQQSVLQKNEQGRYRIVAGTRRLRALQNIGYEESECRIAPSEMEEKDLFLWNFHDNLDRGFNTIEQVLVVKKLFASIAEEELITEYLPLLILPPKKEILQRYLKLAEISPLYQNALLQGRLFPETVEKTLNEFLPFGHIILALFITLQWGFQKQKGFLSDLQEIARRDGQESETILFSSSFVEVLQKHQWTPQQKGMVLRHDLHSRLFPFLTKTETEFHKALEPLNLDQRTTITPPPFFEGGRYSLEITFSNGKELNESLRRLQPALERGQLDDLP